VIRVCRADYFKIAFFVTYKYQKWVDLLGRRCFRRLLAIDLSLLGARAEQGQSEK
jgi:hypothetical protein